jgi:haloalkane dehalogenase
MKRILLTLLVTIVAVGAVVSFVITRDGKLVTPQGDGMVTLAAGTFEAFMLPDYAAKFVTDDYKSYLVEVEPGIKVHVLEVGTGYPIFRMHGNPTSGFLYRKVVARLPTDRVRVIMPTLVGLSFPARFRPVSKPWKITCAGSMAP